MSYDNRRHPDLQSWFRAVDRDGNGRISSDELQTALMNGDWTPFNAETCRLMVGMFDTDKSGTIEFHEFAALWKYVNDWKSCFERFDTDRSGSIDIRELSHAFKTFGYNLSQNFAQLCILRFDRTGRGTIAFDAFIQCCVMLHTLTEAFKKKDAQRRGVVTLRFEEYLEMVLDTSVVLPGV